jgi:hypothetical protein
MVANGYSVHDGSYLELIHADCAFFEPVLFASEELFVDDNVFKMVDYFLGCSPIVLYYLLFVTHSVVRLPHRYFRTVRGLTWSCNIGSWLPEV